MNAEETTLLEVVALEVQAGPRFRMGPVSFEVRGGERVALVGPSGAGKTTLLRQIAGTGAGAERGSVRIDGNPVAGMRRKARAAAVGLLHQSHDLVDQLSVLHNVQAGLLGRWSLGKALWALVGPAQAPAADRALEEVGLAERVHDRTSDLSGGERQRVAIARLMTQDPRLILADEPVASLDPSLADEVLTLLTERVAADDRALLCSLHQPDLAIRHFDRVIGMREGLIRFDLPAAAFPAAQLHALYTGVEP